MLNVKKIFSLTTKPKFVFVGILLGILIGVYFKPIIPFSRPLGDAYRSLLVLCILPIVFVRIVDGLASMLQVENAGKKITKFIVIVVINALLISALTTGSILLAKNKLHVSSSQQNVLATENKELMKREQKTAGQPNLPDAVEKKSDKEGENKFSFLVKQFVPDNIFTAFNEGVSLKAVVLALLIGVALGKVRKDKAVYFFSALKELEGLFNKIFHWVLYFSSLGMMCIFSGVVGDFDYHLFRVTLNLVVLTYVIVAVFMAPYCFVICTKLRVSLFKFIAIFKDTLLLSCATQSVSVAIPFSIDAFSLLGCNKEAAGFVLSLGSRLNRQADIIKFAIALVFSMVFYNVNLSVENILIATILSAFFGSFVDWFALPAMLVIAAGIIGMPPTLGIALIMVIDMFLYFTGVAFTLFGNYMAVALVAKE